MAGRSLSPQALADIRDAVMDLLRDPEVLARVVEALGPAVDRAVADRVPVPPVVPAPEPAVASSDRTSDDGVRAVHVEQIYDLLDRRIASAIRGSKEVRAALEEQFRLDAFRRV